MQVGDSHAVVADGDSGVDGGLQAVFELFPGNHAAPALDDHGVIGDRASDGIQSGNEVKLEVLSGMFL